MNRLENKTAWITGGAQGLGEAAAKRLAEEGATVYITDLNAEIGEHSAEQLRAKGLSVFFIEQDVCNPSSWENVLATILQQRPSLDILVNNAGICITGDIENETFENWQKTLSVNLDAVFLGTQTAVKAMQENGGSIINISSIEGMVGQPDIPAYNASKGGVRLLTKSAALHCARQNYAVRVNSVHPGFILTEMVQQGIDALLDADPTQTVAAFTQDIPLGKMGEPLDIANGVLFLASDESKYMTGSELVIDGGYTAR